VYQAFLLPLLKRLGTRLYTPMVFDLGPGFGATVPLTS